MRGLRFPPRTSASYGGLAIIAKVAIHYSSSDHDPERKLRT
jgi:hypothetical protein